MNSLLAFTIEAHGGLDIWHTFKNISARINGGGMTWIKKQHPNLLIDTYVSVDTQKQNVSYLPLNEKWHSNFTPNHVVIEENSGAILEELINPRLTFENHTRETPWSRLQALYFASYAIWTYFNAPFDFAKPDYDVKEIELWEENNEQWRRLQVTFPESIATHNPVQTFYIDESGLIRRHDYNVEIVENATSSHYLHDYVEVQGIKIATKRRVYLRKPDNTALLPEPVLVSLEISEIKFN